MKKCSIRLTAALLSLLLLATGAQALTLEQAKDLLSTYYIDPIPQEVLDQDTIEGMIQTLGDPYTEYFTPEEYQAFTSSMRDTSLVGIGVISQNTGEGLLLTGVLSGSPAEQGGLEAGDIITAIDGQATLAEDSDTLSAWLSGEAGSHVTLTCEREGSLYTVTLERAEIFIPTASAELEDGHLALINCTAFGKDTTTHMTEEVDRLNDQADRWIIDLRRNGGGVVSDAIRSSALFAGSGVLAYLRDGAGRYSAWGVREEAHTEEPAIVLTSASTASAAELFSSAIRDRKAGIVVGGRTYGKGVAQSVFDQSSQPDYFADGSGMKITSERFFSSNGTATDTVGVIPHLMVDPNQAEMVARLLSDTGPQRDTSGFLRVDLVRHWYIRLERALSPDYQAAFTELLEALPSTAQLWKGSGGADGWTEIAPDALAGSLQLPYQPRGFTDSRQSPYWKAIDLLATYGLVAGTGDGSFHPEAPLTRAQLCALLARALNCRIYQGESRFSDVSMEDWYGQAVHAAAAMGLVNGVGGGRFAPDAAVDHQQFIAIMGRLAQNLNAYFYESAKNKPEDALDNSALSPAADWAREGVWLMAQGQKDTQGQPINLLWDDLENIDMTKPTTREEAAALLCAVLAYTGVLPV